MTCHHIMIQVITSTNMAYFNWYVIDLMLNYTQHIDTEYMYVCMYVCMYVSTLEDTNTYGY
jgi:hypothetical protein